jgi:SAM-dependent methyltransferase
MAEPDDLPGRPSAFFEAQFAALAEAARGDPILDLACGRGRHARAAASRGLRVVALDRNRAFLNGIVALEIDGPGSIEAVESDLESAADPPLEQARFGGILVFRYLHRPLMPWIERGLRPGGLLVYETFTVAQRGLGWGPGREGFLLQPQELPSLVPNLEVIAYDEGLSADDPPAQTARLLARRPA